MPSPRGKWFLVLDYYDESEHDADRGNYILQHEWHELRATTEKEALTEVESLSPESIRIRVMYGETTNAKSYSVIYRIKMKMKPPVAF